MIIGIDFDGTLIEQSDDFDNGDLRLLMHAREALQALKRAGHILIVHSGRANLAHREDWKLNPLWRDGVVPFDESRWAKNRPLFEARYQAMVAFVKKELAGLIDAIDDGRQGKPSVDLWIDDRAIGRFGVDIDWRDIVQWYGEESSSNP